MRVHILVLILATYVPTLVHLQSESIPGISRGGPLLTETRADFRSNGSSTDVSSTAEEVRPIYLDPRRIIEHVYPRTSRPAASYDRRYSRYSEEGSRPGVRRYRPYSRRRRPYSRTSALGRRYGRPRGRPSDRRRTYRRRLGRRRPLSDPYYRDYDAPYDGRRSRSRRRYRSRPRSSRRLDRREYYARYRDEEYRPRDRDYTDPSPDYPEYRDRRVGRDRRRGSAGYREDRRRSTGRSRRRRVEYDSPYVDERVTDLYLSDETDPRLDYRDLGRDRYVDDRLADERPSDRTVYRWSGRESRNDFREDSLPDRRLTVSSRMSSVDSPGSVPSDNTTQLKTTENINPPQSDTNIPEANLEQTPSDANKMNLPDGFINNSKPDADGSNKQVVSNSDVIELQGSDITMSSSNPAAETINDQKETRIVGLSNTFSKENLNNTPLAEFSASSDKLVVDLTQDNVDQSTLEPPTVSTEKQYKVILDTLNTMENSQNKSNRYTKPAYNVNPSAISLSANPDIQPKDNSKTDLSVTSDQKTDVIPPKISDIDKSGAHLSNGSQASPEILPKNSVQMNEISINVDSTPASLSGSLDENSLSEQRSTSRSLPPRDGQDPPVASRRELPIAGSNTSPSETSIRDKSLPPLRRLQPPISYRDDLPLSDRDIPPHLRDERVSSRRPRLRPSRDRGVSSSERPFRDERLPLRRRFPSSRRYGEEPFPERSLRDERPVPRRSLSPIRTYRDDRTIPESADLPSARPADAPPSERPLEDERLPPRRRLPPPRRHRDEPPVTGSDDPSPERPLSDERLPPRRRLPPLRRYRDEPPVTGSDGPPPERPLRDERIPSRRRLPSPRTYRDDSPATGSDVSRPERPLRDEGLPPRRRLPPSRRYRDDPPVTRTDIPPRERPLRDERPPAPLRRLPSRRYRDDPPGTGSDVPPYERPRRDERLPPRRRRPPPRRYRDEPLVTVSDVPLLRDERPRPRRRLPAEIGRSYRDEPPRPGSDAPASERPLADGSLPGRSSATEPALSERPLSDEPRPPRRLSRRILPPRRPLPPERPYRDEVSPRRRRPLRSDSRYREESRRRRPFSRDRRYRSERTLPRRRSRIRDRTYRDDPRDTVGGPYRDEPPVRRRFRPRERRYRRILRPRDRPIEETSRESSRSSLEGRDGLPSRDSSAVLTEGPPSADVTPPSTSAPPEERTPVTRTVSTEEPLRLGVVRARGGENGYPVHGGFCPGETCADGGLAAGVQYGTGAGTLSAFLRRRRTGTNEDIREYERRHTSARTV
ncbi:titin-like [Mercenaria mercenaria]|uniref:titin-like n=1 Tax=Mercenaria mercenaria TaxID=6596 RepID=UPI00234E8D3D|nr:titin-like [Mercenaria mercenaria]